jgi:hypothetical protein
MLCSSRSSGKSTILARACSSSCFCRSSASASLRFSPQAAPQPPLSRCQPLLADAVADADAAEACCCWDCLAPSQHSSSPQPLEPQQRSAQRPLGICWGEDMTVATALLLLTAVAAVVLRPALSAEVMGYTSPAGPRLAIEQTHTLVLTPSSGEPPFHAAAAAVCVVTSAGSGFAIGLPTHQPINATSSDGVILPVRKNLMQGLLIVPAKVKSAKEATCELPSFGTVGNTSVCIVLGHVDPFGAAPPKLLCNAGADNSTYGAAFFSRFALFSPQFGRRPFVREETGSIVVLTDRSLRGQPLRMHATIAGMSVSHSFTGGTNISVPFSLSPLPASVLDDVDISLTLGDGHTVVSHTRTFVRVAPPEARSGVVAWQVDHASKGLLVDGVPFIAAGWFGSGGLHESAGLPVAAVAAAAHGARTMSLSELDALAAASTTTEWGRQGHTFVKAGFMPRMGDDPWAKESVRLSLEYLDAAAA